MKKTFYPQLDGLRAVAVIAVILSHGVPFDFITSQLGLGFWGVDLFFVLSGFLITEILLKQIHGQEKSSSIIKSFYLKRTLRIFPVYYLLLFLVLALNLDGCLNYILYTFTYTLNFYNASSGMEGRYLSHLWSLCVEEQFYLIWPFLLLLIRPRFHKQLILSLIAVGLVFRFAMTLVHYHNFEIYNYRIMPASLDALGIGAVMAYLKFNNITIFKKIINYTFVPILSFVFYLVITFVEIPFKMIIAETFLRFCASICCFFIIGRAVIGYEGRFGRLLQSPAMQYLGKISYGMYLFHLLVQLFFDDYVDGYILAHFSAIIPDILKYNIHLFMLPVIIFVTICMAGVSYNVIEKPFLRLKAKFSHI